VGRPELAQAFENRSGQRNDPLLVALADNPQLTVDPVDGANLERDCLSGTQAAGVDDGAAGFVDGVLQAGKEVTDLGVSERIGEPLLLGLTDLFFENKAQSKLSVLR
jgi:hypothetical protein